MAGETIGQLADNIGTPLDRLLLQIEEAGLPQRSADDVIDENEIHIGIRTTTLHSGRVSNNCKSMR